MTDKNLDESEKINRLQGALGSARDAVSGSVDKISGTAYRRQFEQFSKVVETTVVGVHRDLQELAKRVEALENVDAAPSTPDFSKKIFIAALAISIISIVVAILAFVGSR